MAGQNPGRNLPQVSHSTINLNQESEKAAHQGVGQNAAKRLLDVAVASSGLVLLSPLLLLVALLTKSTSRGPVLFRQQRVGRHFRRFDILKFRTMHRDADRVSRPLTVGRDGRITTMGRFFRRTKIDELPQLFNVLKGDMSLVGPRPEVPQYVELFREDFQKILSVRPGMTDVASIRYRDEAAVLGRADDPEQEYVETILPTKIALAKKYVDQCSLRYDLRLIGMTIWALLRGRSEIAP